MTENPFHPDLRSIAARIPRFSFNPFLLRLARLGQRIGPPKPIENRDVIIEDVTIAGPDGHSVRVRLYRPANGGEDLPALLWMHGGGYILGRPEQDEAHNIALCCQLNMVVAAVAYRLAPEWPFPVPLEDCYSALAWLHSSAHSLRVDPRRVAVGGPSAGAGLAAGLALLARDRGGPAVAFQLLVYPMIDDRTGTEGDIDESRLRLWTLKSNRFGWRQYVGQSAVDGNALPYCAPARAENLAGLPPAWVGVGTCDLFHAESLVYARRLQEAGVTCDTIEVAGAFHGFDAVAAQTDVARNFRQAYFAALAQALGIRPS